MVKRLTRFWNIITAVREGQCNQYLRRLLSKCPEKYDQHYRRTRSFPRPPRARWRCTPLPLDEAGQRVDNFLMRHFKTVPRRVYRLLRKGEVRVNRKRVDAEYRLAEGDEVRLPPVRIEADSEPGRPSSSLLELIEKAVIFQDRHVLVLDKPAGVAVHGGSGMSFGVIEALRASRPRETLELVHRLDRDTSGCLMVARDRTTLVSLHALIRGGGMHKTYLALVAGSWQLGTKRIDAPLATDNRQHGERHVRVASAGKDSVSVFKPVQFFGSLATLMEVDIPTGRTHQIRVHASFAATLCSAITSTATASAMRN